MATSNDKIEITAEEMLDYRNQLVLCLKRSSDLLNQIKKIRTIDQKDILTEAESEKLHTRIQEEIHKLEHFEVVLSVVGTMKAGKSTMINAIVGREIMPNRNSPMTTLPTLIYHTPKQTEPKLSFVAEPANHFVGQLKTVFKEQPECLDMTEELSKTDMQAIIQKIRKGQCRFEPEYKGEKEIFDFLKQLNDLVRLGGYLGAGMEFPFDEYNHIDKLPKIEVAFKHLVNTSAKGRLVLLDTPGPNEAGQEDLSEVLEKQLKRSSVVLLVVDYAQIGSKAGKEVQEIIAKLPTLKSERLFVLLNQIDREDSKSNSLEEIVQDFAKLTFTNTVKDEKGEIVEEVVKVKVKAENIFPISALNAYLTNRMLDELSHHGKPEYQENTWVSDFADAIMRVYDAEEWEEEPIGKIERKAQKLLSKSRFETLHNQLIVNMQQNAVSIVINRALDFCKQELQKEFDNFHESWSKTLGKSKEDIQELVQTIAECRKDIEKLSDVKNKVQKQVSDILDKTKREVEQHKKNVQDQVQEWIGDFANGQVTKIEQQIANLKRELPSFADDILAPFKNADKKNELYRLQEKLQATDDHIVFDDERDADNFFDNAVEQYFAFVQVAHSALDKSISTQINQLIEQLKDTEKEINTVVEQMGQRIEKEGFNLKLPKPKFSDFAPLKLRKLSKKGVINKEKHTYWVDSDGFWAWCKRKTSWLHRQKNAGREKRTETLHKLSKTGLRQMFNTEWQEYRDIFDQETERKLDAFGSEWIENCIDKIHNETKKLLDELDKAIEVSKGDKKVKEQTIQEIEEVKEQYQEIQQDMDMVRSNCPE